MSARLAEVSRATSDGRKLKSDSADMAMRTAVSDLMVGVMGMAAVAARVALKINDAEAHVYAIGRILALLISVVVARTSLFGWSGESEDEFRIVVTVGCRNAEMVHFGDTVDRIEKDRNRIDPNLIVNVSIVINIIIR